MIIEDLTKALQKAIKKVTGQASKNIQVTESSEKSFGDFATNAALMLAKSLGNCCWRASKID